MPRTNYTGVPRTNILTLDFLITHGLGYCCEYSFFTYFRNKATRLIAARLGVTTRAVRAHRAAVRCGRLKCECRERCLREAELVD